MGQLIYEIDENKKAVFGRHDHLLNAALNGSDIKLGLDAYSYEEIILFPSIAVKNGVVFCMQPFHKSSVSVTDFSNPERSYQPYEVVMIYLSNCEYYMIRKSIDHRLMYSSFLGQGPYRYYKWLSEDCYQQYNTSPQLTPSQRQTLQSELKHTGRDVKVRFDYEGTTYIATTDIIYFSNEGPNPVVSVKTHPVILLPNDVDASCQTPEKLEKAEFLVSSSGHVDILRYTTYRHFQSSPEKPSSKIKRKLKGLFRPNTDMSIGTHKIQCGIYWLLKSPSLLQ